MRVSVLINNYNYGRFVDECLQSIEKQTEKAFEVIFYDDGSTDNSIQVASKYDFVKIIKSTNFGEKPAFNQGNAIYQAFKVSSGDIICLLDSDDFWRSDKIKKIKKAFLQNTNAVLVQHACFEWVNNEIIRTLDYGKRGVEYKKLYKKSNWTGHFNSTSNFAFKREYLLKVLPIEIDKFWQVWPDVRLSRIAPYFGEVISLNEPLTYYRIHGQNDSQIMNSSHKKTLKNQEIHHEYVNSRIIELGFNPIRYKYSYMYLSFFMKAYFFDSFWKFFKNRKK